MPATIESDETAFLSRVLPIMAQDAGRNEYVAIVEGAKGRWRAIGASGPVRQAPDDLLAEALDERRPVVQGDWYVGPLGFTSCGRRAACGVSGGGVERLSTVQNFTRFPNGWRRRWTRSAADRRDQQRLVQQTACLRWPPSGTARDGQLLGVQMAEASTRFAAGRAGQHFFMGPNDEDACRPAGHGVPGGELRIADDAGIVGQVVQSGQPRRVDEDVAAEQREIDRRVDQRLKFQTRSLLCVPLLGQRGELLRRVRSHQ